MLFLIHHKHTPEYCPGGLEEPDPQFFDKIDNQAKKADVNIVEAYLSSSNHSYWFLIEADSTEAIATFAIPLFRIGEVETLPVQTWQEAKAWATRLGVLEKAA